MIWEYLVHPVNQIAVVLQRELEKHGAAGWELVFIHKDGPILNLVFKRFRESEDK